VRDGHTLDVVPSHRLAVDYGTSNTVAVLQRPDGTARPLLFDASPLLPSAVFAEGGGRMLVGRDADHASRLDPARYEPNPKRRINDLDILLGDRSYSMVDLVAAVLRRVAVEAVRVAGGPVSDVTITCPAAWGQARRRVLMEAAEIAQLGRINVVPEPVAAASYFATVLGHKIPPGQCVVVYDLGGGTFDASVVRHAADGLDTLACRGIDDFGGLDLDAMIVDRIGEFLNGRSPEIWKRLSEASDATDRRHWRMLWDDARHSREALSREAAASVHCVLAREDIRVTREEFEELATGALMRTVEVTVQTLQEARVPPEQVAGWFLVGGASRTPLIATLLHRRTGAPPVVLEDPQIVVAEGALHTAPSAAWSGSIPAGRPGAGALRPPSAANAPMSGVPISGGPTTGAPMSGVPMSGAPSSGAPPRPGPFLPAGPRPGQYGPAGPRPGPVMPAPRGPVPGGPMPTGPVPVSTGPGPGPMPGGPRPSGPVPPGGSMPGGPGSMPGGPMSGGGSMPGGPGSMPGGGPNPAPGSPAPGQMPPGGQGPRPAGPIPGSAPPGGAGPAYPGGPISGPAQPGYPHGGVGTGPMSGPPGPMSGPVGPPTMTGPVQAIPVGYPGGPNPAVPPHLRPPLPPPSLAQLAALPVPQAADVLTRTPPAAAVDLLAQLAPPHAALILAAMPIPVAAERLASMAVEHAAVRLASMPPSRGVNLLMAMPARAAADRLVAMPPDIAAQRLIGVHPPAAGQMIIAMPPQAAAARLVLMLPGTAASILKTLPWPVAEPLVRVLPPRVYEALR